MSTDEERVTDPGKRWTRPRVLVATLVSAPPVAGLLIMVALLVYMVGAMAGVMVGGPPLLAAHLADAVLLEVQRRAGSANILLRSLVESGRTGALAALLVLTLGSAAAARAVIRALIRRPVRTRTHRRDEAGHSAAIVSARPHPKPTPRASKILLALVCGVTAVEASAFAGTYLFHSRYLVSTSNAQVDGDRQYINAPQAGMVTDWSVTEGSSLTAREIVGRVRHVGGGAQPGQTIRASSRGVIASSDVTDGTYVTPGMTLAIAYDLDTVYVTARVDDDSVRRVHLGAQVDIVSDAYSGVPVTGVVVAVAGGAAGNFDVYPPTGAVSTSNPQTSVNQYIPVKIALTGTAGTRLVPGMNVTVHIRAS